MHANSTEGPFQQTPDLVPLPPPPEKRAENDLKTQKASNETAPM